jgi:hypothetical protein
MSGRASSPLHAVPFCNSRGGAHDLVAEASAQAGVTHTTDGVGSRRPLASRIFLP